MYFRGVNRKFLAAQYLSYLFKARGRHGIHSAFVYDFYERVIYNPHQYYDFPSIEFLRNKLLHSDESIEVVDFGAGGNGAKTRKISDIANLSSVSAKTGQMLFRLANFMQPKVMVEMGTSLGISSLYQAKACPDAEFITMEGSPATAEVAVKNFKMMKADNIKVITGDFKTTLPAVLKNMGKVDYVLFDGNHRKEATMEYFKAFLPKASGNCVFVFDDIRWSADMFEAWNEIIKEPTTTVTIDLFNIGLVFFRQGQVKEHFVLKF